MPLKPSDFYELLPGNKAWRDEIVAKDPTFFKVSAESQHPATLWIGCADSRVPDSVITKALPGSIFTHRNIANQVHLNDENLLSVLEYAVEHLHVKHIVVIGHTECGGVKACIQSINSPSAKPDETPVQRWLRPLTTFADYLGLAGKNVTESVSRLVRENVKLQVANLANTEVIRKAWVTNPTSPEIHGWLYELDTGLIRDLQIRGAPIVPQKQTT